MTNSERYDKYKEYAQQVVDGRLTVCKYVRQACARYLSWFDKYTFVPEMADRAEDFIGKLKHFTGSHSGKPFKLLAYQKWMIYNIFGFYRKDRPDRRVVNYVYIELARKQGKTALAAAICLYMLIADGEKGSEVELVANSRQQAKICFGISSYFVKSVDPRGRYFQRYRDSITFPHTDSVLQVLSGDASGNDGYNSYCFCLDECHAQPDSRLWDVMVSSQGMRRNPLAIIITTAGFYKHRFCYSYRNTCVEILAGIVDNDAQFVAIYTLDEDDDWADPTVWIKSNPSLGVTVEEDYLMKQVRGAKANTTLEVGVRTKNFNQWVSSSDTWIPADTIIQSTANVRIEDFGGYTAYMGVDLAYISDFTALAVVIPADGKFYCKVWYFLPESALNENANAELYKLWHRKKEIIVTPGNVTDYDYIITVMQEVAGQLMVEKVGYDAYNATQWAINATEQGFPLEPFSQALWNFNRPTKEFERLIRCGKVVLDNNEITRWCFANTVLKHDHNENVKPVKGSGEANKIDGVIGIVEALGMYLNSPRYASEILTLT